jgi:PAS domain S-box-containing protein
MTASTAPDEGVFRALFDASPDALIVADADGRLVLANAVAAQLLGYTLEQLLAMNVDALVPDAIRPRHASYREAYARAPRPRPMGTTQSELVARRGDGSEVMVEIALSPLQVEGRMLVLASIRDIRAYPRVQQALQRARYAEHLAQLGRLAVDARDPQQLLQEVPAIAAQALQVPLAMVLRTEAGRETLRVAGGSGLLSDESLGSLLARHELAVAAIERGEPVQVDDRHADVALPASWVAAGFTSALAVPLFDRGRQVGVLIAAAREQRRFGDDERRLLESLASLLATSLQRAHSEEALNHAQKLETVGQLTGGIAHDFNNLLTVIQGNLQVLEELPRVAGDPHAPPLVQAATRAARRGAELTAKLLAFASRQVLAPSAVDVQAMLGSLADMLRRTLDQRIRIEVAVPPELPRVRADAGQLDSALLNIAINARDAMPDGGVLRFEARAVDALPDALVQEFDDAAPAASDGFVAVSVADSGSGMPDAVKERAFEPFFTTKEVGRGTGLGLSTVYGFAKQSHGAVEIASTPGAGTTITLYLPCTADTDDVVGDDDIDEIEPLPSGLKVLLVEDDADVRSVMRQHLAALRCTVTAAVSGEHALRVLVPDASFDLLLSDIALGAGMRGTEFAARAQQLHPAMAVLLMSGYSAELLEADQSSPSSWELLPKPCSREELAAAMSRALRSSAG